MPQAGSRPAAALRWLAPVLLLGIASGLAPFWWETTVPPVIATTQPWRNAQGTLMVPAAAVRRAGSVALGRSIDGDGVVFVIDRGVARSKQVRLGSLGGEAVEITGGLDEDAVIAANPPRGLEDRHRVVTASRSASMR